MSMKRWSFFSLLALAGVGVYGVRRRLMGRWLKLRPARYAVSVRRGLRIPMPDGVALAADLYTPRANRLFPTILIRSPYGRNEAAGPAAWIVSFAARRFAERGYIVLAQDVRGRFDSPGEFDPFRHEAADGRATLAWIEAQPWFNGLVGMWGPSYLGYVQWAVAPQAPLYLKALAPAMSGMRLPMMGARDGAMGTDLQLRWIHTLDVMQRARSPFHWLHASRLTQAAKNRAMRRAARITNLCQADRAITGRTVPFFQDWLAHPQLDDPYWQAVDPSRQVDQMSAPAHLVGGWYDILLRETVEDYLALRRAGRTPYLTIGPWRHTDTAGLIESLRQSLVWFDAHLKGDRRWLRAKPVRVYVMGKDEWREFETWPPPARSQSFWLHPGQELHPEPPPVDSPPDQYTYDPRHPTPAVGGNLYGAHAGRVDNRRLEARADVLTYTTPPLEADLCHIGTAHLSLHARSDQESCDFFVRLCDVHPNGASFNICDGFLRLPPGGPERQPDGSLRVEMDLWPTAHCFQRGHRLRLLIASAAHPRWHRNSSQRRLLDDDAALLPARQTVYLDSTCRLMIVA